MTKRLTIVPRLPVWRMSMHMNFGSKGHQLTYRDDEMGVQCDIFTPKRSAAWRTYSIDGDEREFKTGQELMAALAERAAQPSFQFNERKSP